MNKKETPQKDEIVLLGDRVLIKLLEKNDYTQTQSGLIMAASMQDKTEKGTVVAVGRGRITEYGEFVSMSVKVGDVVMFSSFAKEPVFYNRETLYVVNEPNIVAIIK